MMRMNLIKEQAFFAEGVDVIIYGGSIGNIMVEMMVTKLKLKR